MNFGKIVNFRSVIAYPSYSVYTRRKMLASGCSVSTVQLVGYGRLRKIDSRSPL